MMRLFFGLFTCAVTTGAVLSLGAAPPEERDAPLPRREKGQQPPPPPPGGGFRLGKVLPPHVLDEVELTPEQAKQLAELEQDVRTRLNKILTDEQKTKIAAMRRPPMPPGPGSDGPPPGGRPPRGRGDNPTEW